jgi:hypothetical protein
LNEYNGRLKLCALQTHKQELLGSNSQSHLCRLKIFHKLPELEYNGRNLVCIGSDRQQLDPRHRLMEPMLAEAGVVYKDE